ncbi:hypothetical protein KUTeg_000584 [Tegillarca granosa]|uniref:MICOS complex subunit MIC13 n=1 Tax=Tegillarca granosa TaxID=220873 RepID=A0ABQ9FXZ0_TEGGR|nr:hypothetical protein KUTeg_000584 [Tegillarca granosa]
MAMFYKALAAAGSAAVGYGIYTAQPVAPLNETIHKVKVCELPIYQTPDSRYKYEDVQEEVSSFRQGVSEVRKVIWKCLDSTKKKTTSDKIEGDMGQSEAEDKDMYSTRS